MLFRKNRKNRIEEDLEKIRRANLPPEKLEEEDRIKKQKEESIEKLELEKNDLLAMILAVFSLIVPYILIFIAIISFVVFMLYRFILT